MLAAATTRARPQETSLSWFVVFVIAQQQQRVVIIQQYTGQAQWRNYLLGDIQDEEHKDPLD